MEKIIIIGSGGFGREVKMLIDQINNKSSKYNIIGFIDDNHQKRIINGVPYLGNLDYLINQFSGQEINVAIAIADPISKRTIHQCLAGSFKFPNLIHPSVIIGMDNVNIGEGNIICANSILTVDIILKDFITLNLACTVGHDTIINSYSSFMPTVNISGEVCIEKCCYVGTGAKIINQVRVGINSIIGAGAVVTKDIPANCTAVGMPARPVKFHENDQS